MPSFYWDHQQNNNNCGCESDNDTDGYDSDSTLPCRPLPNKSATTITTCTNQKVAREEAEEEENDDDGSEINEEFSLSLLDSSSSSSDSDDWSNDDNNNNNSYPASCSCHPLDNDDEQKPTQQELLQLDQPPPGLRRSSRRPIPVKMFIREAKVVQSKRGTHRADNGTASSGRKKRGSIKSCSSHDTEDDEGRAATTTGKRKRKSKKKTKSKQVVKKEIQSPKQQQQQQQIKTTATTTATTTTTITTKREKEKKMKSPPRTFFAAAAYPLASSSSSISTDDNRRTTSAFEIGDEGRLPLVQTASASFHHQCSSVQQGGEDNASTLHSSLGWKDTTPPSPVLDERKPAARPTSAKTQSSFNSRNILSVTSPCASVASASFIAGQDNRKPPPQMSSVASHPSLPGIGTTSSSNDRGANSHESAPAKIRTPEHRPQQPQLSHEEVCPEGASETIAVSKSASSIPGSDISCGTRATSGLCKASDTGVENADKTQPNQDTQHIRKKPPQSDLLAKGTATEFVAKKAQVHIEKSVHKDKQVCTPSCSNTQPNDTNGSSSVFSKTNIHSNVPATVGAKSNQQSTREVDGGGDYQTATSRYNGRDVGSGNVRKRSRSAPPLSRIDGYFAPRQKSRSTTTTSSKQGQNNQKQSVISLLSDDEDNDNEDNEDGCHERLAETTTTAPTSSQNSARTATSSLPGVENSDRDDSKPGPVVKKGATNPQPPSSGSQKSVPHITTPIAGAYAEALDSDLEDEIALQELAATITPRSRQPVKPAAASNRESTRERHDNHTASKKLQVVGGVADVKMSQQERHRNVDTCSKHSTRKKGSPPSDLLANVRATEMPARRVHVACRGSSSKSVSAASRTSANTLGMEDANAFARPEMRPVSSKNQEVTTREEPSVISLLDDDDDNKGSESNTNAAAATMRQEHARKRNSSGTPRALRRGPASAKLSSDNVISLLSDSEDDEEVLVDTTQKSTASTQHNATVGQQNVFSLLSDTDDSDDDRNPTAAIVKKGTEKPKAPARLPQTYATAAIDTAETDSDLEDERAIQELDATVTPEKRQPRPNLASPPNVFRR